MSAAGRLGLAVLGGYLGGPIGFAVGSAVGGLLFPEHQRLPDQSGPRLGESQLTNSQYGQGIPKIWGTYRVAGNVIWASPVHETRRSNTQRVRQGKGGSTTSQTTHEFIYTQSFALALCEGVAKRVTKIFFDGSVVYDMTSTSGATTLEGLKFRFYPGDDAQLPDSIIESYEGVGNVPAHRGLCYLVFDDLDVTNYRRIPTIEVHVQMGGESVVIEEAFNHPGGFGAVNLETRTKINWPVYLTNAKQLVSLDDLQPFRELTVDYGTNSMFPLGPSADGDFFVAESSGAGGKVWLVDGATLQQHGFMQMAAWAQNSLGRNTSFRHVSAIGKEHLIFLTDYFKYTFDGLRLQAHDFYGNGAVQVEQLSDGFRGYRFCHAHLDKCYILAVRPNHPEIFAVYETGTVESVSADPISGEPEVTITITTQQRAVFTTADIDPDGRIPAFWAPGFNVLGALGLNIDGVVYDPSDDSLLISFGRYLVTAKVDCTTWAIKWRFISDPDGAVSELDSWSYENAVGHDISAGTWLVNRGPNLAGFLIDLSSGLPIKQIPSSFTAGESYSRFVYDSRGLAAYSTERSTVLYFDRGIVEKVPVAEILEDLRVEVDAIQADYNDIQEFEVDGYARMSPTTSRTMIEPLATVFGFDGVDAGTHLRWIKRGGDSVGSVVRDDLAQRSGEVIQYTRAQEPELPRLVSVTYADQTRDFEQSTYHASRYYGNEQYLTMQSSNQVRIEAPMAIEADEAKRRADTLLRESWNSRDTARFSIPRYFLEHEVGDVVTLLTPGRVPQDVRLDGLTVGSNLEIEINATSQDSSQYNSIVEAEVGQDYIDQHILTSRDLMTRLFLLPIPLLLDSSDRARQEMLVQFVMGAYSPHWRAGVLEHDEGAGFDAAGSVQTDAVWGSVVGFVPAADPDTVFATNETLTIRVALANGELDSVTQAEMLSGMNAAAIIHSDSRAEVIQFRSAVLDDDGVYTLSGILRGRRGTDYWASFDSPGGASFVGLTPDSVGAALAPLSDLGRSRLYRGYEIRQDPERGDSRSMVMRGIEMMPYAPVHLESNGEIGNGDVLLAWERRTRLRGDLADGTPTVPLQEDAEAYEIDIYINSLPVRTISSATPSASYTTAQQVEDGVSAFDLVEWVVFQVSAQVGRGFPSARSRLQGMAIDVAQQSVIALTGLGPSDADVAQQSVVIFHSTESAHHVAQQSVILLHTEFEMPPVEVAQQSTIILRGGGSSENMDVAQQSTIILREV